MNRRFTAVASIFVVLVTLACGNVPESSVKIPDVGLGFQATATATADAMATGVAGTMTALAPTQTAVPQTATPGGKPTDAPTASGPTATPLAPTATTTPVPATPTPVAPTLAPASGNAPAFTANVPAEVHPAKFSTTCVMPGGCNVLSKAGVLGADKLEDANANDSAVWTGSANHYILENETGSLLLPESGYGTGFAKSMHIVGGGYDMNFPPCGVDCGWGFVARGLLDGPGDRHISLAISEFGAAGAMTVTRYPVPVHASEYFSQDYVHDQAVNFLQLDNCGATGCNVMYLAVIDYNDGSLTILRYTKADGWVMVWVNVV